MTRYPDIDLFLTRNLTNNDIFVKSEEDSVSQNIKNLLLTFTGEKIFSPTYGGNLYNKKFDNLGENAKSIMISEIRNTLTLYEKRIIVTNINISSKLKNCNIQIDYRLIDTITPLTVVI